MPKLVYLAYGFPAFLLALAEFPLTIYVPTFFAVELGIGLAEVGAVFAITRILDIMTDPVIGALTDRTNTHWGRRKPYIILGIPVFIALILILFNPSKDLSSTGLLAILAAFYLVYGVIYIPYTALAGELSTNQFVRTRLFGARAVFSVIGTLVAALFLQLAAGSVKTALQYLSWLGIGLGTISMLFVFYFLPAEQSSMVRPNKISLVKAIRLIAEQSAIWKLFSAFFLNQVGNALAAGLVLLYIEYVLDMASYSGIFLGSLFASSAICLPVWFWLEKKVGQSRCWAISIFLACFIFIFVPFLQPGDFWPYMAVCVFAGATFGCDAVLPASMLTQCLKADKVISGTDRAGHLFALKGILTKTSLVAPAILAFPLLAYVDFNPDLTNPSAQSIWWLISLYSIVPAVIKLCAFFIVFSMRKKDETYPKNNKVEIC